MFDQVSYHFFDKKILLPSGVEINYMDEGEGKQTILFVHGLANYADVWWQQLNVLKKHYRCIAIDLPGCGKSSRHDYAYTMVFFSEIIKETIEQLKLGEVTLCGHSMGGQVAAITTLRFPHLIQKLVLCSPAGFEKYTSTEISVYKGMLSVGQFFFSDETQLVQSLHHSFYQMPDSAKTMIKSLTDILHQDDINHWRSMVKSCIHGMLDEQIYDLLKYIQCPVLIVFGEKDQLIPNVYFHPTSTKVIAEIAAAEIKQAQLVIVQQCGHFVFYEKAKEVNEAIEKFVQ